MSENRQDKLPYRIGVGALLLNRQGQVFVGRRIDTPGNAWQLPQGGVDDGEAPEKAVVRELREEVGTDRATILAASRDWYTYELPEALRGKVWKGRYRGQKQRWFVLRFDGVDADIDLTTHHPEFDAWRWVPLERLPSLAIEFKRQLYQDLVAEFEALVGSIAAVSAEPAASNVPGVRVEPLRRHSPAPGADAGPNGVALVTGAARRIGRAIAVDLARLGWTVAVHHRASETDAVAVVDDIVAMGGHARAFAADLASEDETMELFEAVAGALGPVTCLVNNASLFERDEALTATHESWQRHMQVNLRAPFLLTQRLAQALPSGRSAVVINLLDQRVWNLTPHFTSYTVSKAGLWTLTQTLAMALAPRVRVNAVGPGPTLPSARQTEPQFERQWANVPLARPVAVEEICAAVRFLLDVPSITGQMIAVDAGQHLGWTSLRARGGADE